jgi:hypothetical protein
MNILIGEPSDGGRVRLVHSIQFVVMKRLLLPSLAVSSLVLFTLGCGEKPVVTEAPPPPVRLKSKPKVYRGDDEKAAEAARVAAIAGEIAELEAEAAKLRQEIAQEQLAVDRAALEEEQRRLDQERAAWLNEQVAAAVPAQRQMPVSSTPVVLPPARDYSLFYTELAVHGSWFQSVDYGYVWQPAVALQTSWRPYTVGRWAACDRGWTWLSDEPFGWATYHYGRWAKLKGCGWIWVPGEVWAPAWVAWRRSDQYVGWYPLPPETLYRDEVTYDSSIDKLCGIQPAGYIFISVKQFCLPVHRHCEPPERSGVVCRDTSNITRLRVSRHRVDGSGPKYEWIRDRQPHPPDRYILASDPLTKGDRKFHIERDKLCVFSPVMRAPWNAALRPRDVAGPLPEGAVVPQGTVPPDRIQRRFREDKKHWMEAGAKALQGESVHRLNERQERVEALTAAMQNPPAPRRTTREQGQPSEKNLTSPRPGVKPAGAPTEPSLAERRAQVRKEVAARQAELARLRGLPVAGETAPSRIASGGRPVATSEAHLRPAARDQTLVRTSGQFPEVAPPRPRVAPVEAPRVMRTPAVSSPNSVETPVASNLVEETGPAGTIAEEPPVHSDLTAPEVLVPSKAQADLEIRRAEVARLKETLTVRQEQKMGPQPQGDPSLNGSGQSGASGQLVRRVQETGPVPPAEPAGQTPPVQVTGPQAPAGMTGPLPEEAAARQEAAAVLAERREKAARITEELAARQQALQQQREAREQAQAEREQALAQSAAEAARQREAAQAAQMALAAEQRQQQQQQSAAETAARQQESAGEAAHQQQQAQLAAQTEAAREQQRETEANRQRQAAEAAQQEQAAREQVQRQAGERARQEAMARLQREASERAQQEQAAREQAQRQAEERARQEEMARQQREAAERAQQEQAAREQAQRQAEERARQEQAARDQAVREQAQRQAEEEARASAAAAKNGNK